MVGRRGLEPRTSALFDLERSATEGGTLHETAGVIGLGLSSPTLDESLGRGELQAKSASRSESLSSNSRPALAAQPLHRCICLRGPFRERSAFEERLGGFSSQGDIYTVGLFVGRTLKGVRELYELGGYIAQLGAHRIVRWARKPVVEPSRPIDSVGEFYQIAFAKDDLLSERSRLRQATFAVLYGWIVNGAVIVFHKHDCAADWWAAVDSNHVPPRYQHGALPVELAAQTLEPSRASDSRTVVLEFTGSAVLADCRR